MACTERQSVLRRPQYTKRKKIKIKFNKKYISRKWKYGISFLRKLFLEIIYRNRL